MRQAETRIAVETSGKGFVNVTRRIEEWVNAQRMTTGLLTIFIRHTSASLVVQENADPAVLADLEEFFGRLAPEGGPYAHGDEGPDDMPAHIRAALTSTSVSIPISSGRLALGTWQGIYLAEHRSKAHVRSVSLHVIGE